VAAVGAIVSHTATGIDWRLQVHTVIRNVTNKVSLQAGHNWIAVCGFVLSKAVNFRIMNMTTVGNLRLA